MGTEIPYTLGHVLILDETFRNLCVDFAIALRLSSEYIFSANLRSISACCLKRGTYRCSFDASDILVYSVGENGVNMLAEGFLFTIAASLIIGTSCSELKHREGVNDQLDDPGTRLTELSTRVDNLSELAESQLHGQQQK